MFTRPLYRVFPLLVAALVLVWLFAYPLYDSHPLIPLRNPHHLNPDRPPPPHGPPPHLPPRPYPPPPRPKPNPGDSQWEDRAQKVKDAFVYAWSGYQKHAAGWDELTPVDGGKVNNFNGWGVTLFDALDTMWIMDLHKEFQESLGFIAKTTFSLTEDNYAPFFETTIRYLGGLLSAYALSGEPILLARADDLGRMLLPAFNTSSGLPKYAVNTVNGKTKGGWNPYVLWAEALSNQLEYKYLAHLTGRAEYFNKTENIMKLMYKANTTNGLFPTMWDIGHGGPANAHYSVGAYADSAHEYLLKQYLLTARSEPNTLELYLNSINGVINNLLYITPTRHLLYVTDKNNNFPTHKLEHLSCFFPGLLALGVHTLATSPPPTTPTTTTTDSPSYTEEIKQLHLWAAQGLAETCWIIYHDSKSGLGSDEVRMLDFGTWSTSHGSGEPKKPSGVDEGLWITQVQKWKEIGEKDGAPPGVPAPGKQVERVAENEEEKRDYRSMRSEYLLRPETVESFFYLWKVTGDPKWRERGWSIFEAIEKHAKTEYGYASVSNIDSEQPQHKNEMPSFFLAETLKYLYLLFTDDDIISLKDYVFNTEAHPLPVFDWSPWEKQEYSITA